MIRTTPLHKTHLALGAKMIDFAGYEMPVQYNSIVQEHLAVRNTAGLFDVSHMGEIFVMGPHAASFVQQLVTNDVSRLDVGQALYTLMCNESGGVIDDLLVYRVDTAAFMLVVNASNINKDYQWMMQHNPMNADLQNVSEHMGLLALQGPSSLNIAAKLIGEQIYKLPSFRLIKFPPNEFLGFKKAIVSRTGYTGGIGLEFYVESENTSTLWDALISAGREFDLQPAGLGARDTLRIEAGFCLYGNELSEKINPYESQLGWVIKLNKDDFVGKSALQRIRSEGPKRKLIGLVMKDRGIPRAGYPIVLSSERPVGHVTSGSQSPILGCGIALALVHNHPDYTSIGQELGVQIRSRILSSNVVKLPFYRNHNR
ncbi:MAG: glycine cleavage system aminomethyltransferase GcvT [Bacteroidetes bacterium]|nr:glycine cleavage system aminomethyltransferase GcvT [Bacteroidota bacterium]